MTFPDFVKTVNKLKARKLVGKIEVAGNVLAKSYMGEKKKSYMDLRPLLQVITDA